jgi:hypothetical protein
MKNAHLLIEGIATLDGNEKSFKALCFPNDTWNGWAKPFIHTSSMEDLLSVLNYGEDTYTIIGGILEIKNLFNGVVEHESTIEPTEINGEIYYNLGYEGLVFEFEETI